MARKRKRKPQATSGSYPLTMLQVQKAVEEAFGEWQPIELVKRPGSGYWWLLRSKRSTLVPAHKSGTHGKIARALTDLTTAEWVRSAQYALEAFDKADVDRWAE